MTQVDVFWSKFEEEIFTDQKGKIYSVKETKIYTTNYYRVEQDGLIVAEVSTFGNSYLVHPYGIFGAALESSFSNLEDAYKFALRIPKMCKDVTLDYKKITNPFGKGITFFRGSQVQVARDNEYTLFFDEEKLQWTATLDKTYLLQQKVETSISGEFKVTVVRVYIPGKSTKIAVSTPIGIILEG